MNSESAISMFPSIRRRNAVNSVLRLTEVKKRVGLSRSSIYAAISAGTFPAQVRLGVRAVGWLAADVESWIATRVFASQAEGNK